MQPTDFLNFKKFLAPVLIQVVYWIGLVAILLGALASFGAASMMGGGFLGIVMALVGAVLGALVWRVVCEIWIVIFSINDRLGTIANKP